MGRPRDAERVEARRQEVAEATWRTIAAHGIEGASLRTIAREGGFSTGTLAYYFRNKQQILLFAGRMVMNGLVERLAEDLPGETPLALLEKALLRELPTTPSARLAWQIWLSFTARVPADTDFRREHEERYRELRELLRATLDAAKRAGELAAGIDRGAATDHILALFDGIGLQALLEPEHFPAAHQRRLLRSAIRDLAAPPRCHPRRFDVTTRSVPFTTAQQLNHRLAVWGGGLFVVGMIGGWWVIGGFVPPLTPNDSAETVAAFYRDGGLQMKFGLMVATALIAFILPTASAITHQLRRIEGSRAIWARTQMASATVTTTMVTIALALWSTTAFRPERDPELTLLMNDLCWVGFTMPVAAIVVWMLAVGFAVVFDQSEKPIYPRWIGFASFWAALLTAPGFPVILFRNGPFAWNGLLAFWIAIVTVIVWFLVLMGLTLIAIREEAAEANAR